MPGLSFIARGSQVQNEALMYSEVVKLGHKTALHIQSLLLLPSEVRPRPVVKDEAGAPLAPTLPRFLKTLSASWWPESLGVRDML